MTVPPPSDGTARQRAATLLARLAATFGLVTNTTGRPLPMVGARIGPWIPVWVATTAMVAVAAAGAALVVEGWIGWAVLGGILAASVRFPEGPWTGVYMVTIGVLLLVSGAEPFTGRLYALIAVVHLVAVLHSVVSGLPWTARLQLRALLGPLSRFATVQLAAQALAGVGALLAGAAVTVPWLAVVAAAGLAAAALTLHISLGADGSREPGRTTTVET